MTGFRAANHEAVPRLRRGKLQHVGPNEAIFAGEQGACSHAGQHWQSVWGGNALTAAAFHPRKRSCFSQPSAVFCSLCAVPTAVKRRGGSLAQFVQYVRS